MWRPKLVVRYGKGSHTPSSPTTTAGYVLLAAIAGALSLGAIAAALSGKPLMLLGLLITQFFLRDAWAWFAATPDERDAFRQRVIAAGGGPDQRSYGGRWRWWQLLGMGLVTAFAFAMAPKVHLLFPAAVMMLAVFVAACIDRIRSASRGRE